MGANRSIIFNPTTDPRRPREDEPESPAPPIADTAAADPPAERRRGPGRKPGKRHPWKQRIEGLQDAGAEITVHAPDPAAAPEYPLDKFDLSIRIREALAGANRAARDVLAKRGYPPVSASIFARSAEELKQLAQVWLMLTEELDR
jgi:hypothetical protein